MMIIMMITIQVILEEHNRLRQGLANGKVVIIIQLLESPIPAELLLSIMVKNGQNGQNCLKWSKMIPNGPKGSKMVKMVKMVKIAINGQNRPKWSKMVQYGPKWSKMVKNGLNVSKIV